MSLSSTTSRTPTVGNDATTVCNYGFRINQAADLLVTVRNLTTGVETVLVLTTDYTVQNVGQASGTITLVNAGQVWLNQTGGQLSSNYKIIVRRHLSYQQNKSIRNQGAFYAGTHEDAFDTLTMMIQDLWDYINRAVVLSETLQPADFDPILHANNLLPIVPGALLGINAAGNGWAFVSPQLGWQAVDIPYSSFSTGSTQNQINAFSLPANCILVGVAMKHTVAFSGGAVASLACDLGIGGNADLFLTAFDCFQAVADSAFVNADVNSIQSFANATNIKIRATSTGANLSALTAGSVRVYYWYMNL